MSKDKYLEERIDFECTTLYRNQSNRCELKMVGKVSCEHYQNNRCTKREYHSNPIVTLQYYQGVD